MFTLTVSGTVARDNHASLAHFRRRAPTPKGIDMNSTVDQLSNDRVADVLSDAKDGARGELRRFFDDVEELLGRVSYINDCRSRSTEEPGREIDERGARLHATGNASRA
jgi:hypothetical protein